MPFCTCIWSFQVKLLEDALVSKGMLLEVPLVSDIGGILDDISYGLVFFHEMPEKPFIRTGWTTGYASSQKHRVKYFCQVSKACHNAADTFVSRNQQSIIFNVGLKC